MREMNTEQYAVGIVTIGYERPVNNLYNTLVQLGRAFLTSGTNSSD